MIFSGSRSQNALCTAVIPSTDITQQKGILIDPRSAEEILADELPIPEAPDAMEKTVVRSLIHTQKQKDTRLQIQPDHNFHYSSYVNLPSVI